MLLEIILTVGVIAALVVLYFRWNYGTLEKLGIPVVKPHFLLGSESDFHKVVGHERDYERFLKYGEIYGVYHFRTPQIHIVDPEIIRNICIKDFDKFVNHDFEISGPLKEMMDFLKDEKWKTVRSALTPLFTSSKIKRMTVQMTEATQDMFGLLKEDIKSSPNKVVENYNVYGDLTSSALDIAARCTLNISVKNPRSPDNDFSKALKEFFPEVPPILMVIFSVFPALGKAMDLFMKEQPGTFYMKIFQKVTADRKKSGVQNGDFIDLLNEVLAKTESPDYKRLNITEATIITQGVEFFIAGIDSIATTMFTLIYYSCQNPEIREKLYEEVDEFFVRHKGSFSQENLAELKYLNACIYETLRLHPTFTRPERKCNEEVEYKGVRIPKGMAVVIPLWPYNRNPKYFPEPHKFDPERFMPENKAKMDMFTFGTFGNGPRMCIGMRYALQCLHVMGLELFRNFHFSVADDAKLEYYPSLFPGVSMIKPLDVNVSLRE